MNKCKRWGKRLGITAGILFALYIIIGFWGVPLIIRHVLLAKFNEQVAGHGEIEAIRFNPFTFQLKLEHFSGYTPDGAKDLHFNEFRVNIQPTSYFGDEWVILEIYLDQPFLNLVIDENGNINIASALGRLQEHVEDIQAHQAEVAAEPDAEPFVIPAIRIDSFKVVNAGFRAQIDSFGQPFLREVNNLSFVMAGVRTNSEHDNPYAFQLETSKGEHIDVKGNLKLDPLSSSGSFSIEQLHLKDFLVFAGDQFGIEMNSGTFNLSIDYTFMPLGKTPRLALENGHVLLQDLSLLPKGETEPFETIAHMEIQGLGIDVLKDEINIDSFTLDDAMLRVVRDSDGVLNLIRYITPPERQAAIASAAQQEAVAKQATAREIRLGVVSADQDLGVALTSAWEQVQELVGLKWDLAVGKVNISKVDLIWRDEFLARPAELRWTDIALSATNLTNGTAPFPFDLGLTMNDTGQIALQGTFTPTPAASAFTLKVTDLPLPPLSPYLDSLAPVRLTSGALSASGKSEIAFPNKGLPELSAEVEAQLNDFALEWAEPAGPFLSWQKLSLAGGAIGTQPMSALASQVTLTAPKINIERLADGSIRLPLPPTKAPETTPTPTSAPPPSPTAKPYSLQVDELIIDQGHVNVQDQSVSPAFAFSVTEIDFRAAPFAAPDIQPMTLALQFVLANGPTGKVNVDGALSPLEPFSATEFKVRTSNVTLAPFAPYAVPVIGQPPVGGQLSATLAYSITTGAITGDNKMQINKVRFGKRPEGIDAPDLPLDLGVAILEDGDGVMHIDIPIKGDVNSPEFTLAHMIQYAIGNVLEKLVTAPFSALGSILPGGGVDSPTYVPFQPGLTTLDAETTKGLADLAQFLIDRPAMIATLTPSIDPEADAEALRTQKFDAMLTAKMAEDNDDAEDATETLFDALPKPDNAPDEDLTLEQQQERIRKNIEITTTDFTTLAQARIAAVRTTMLATPGLDADRLATSEDTPYNQDGPKVIFGAKANLNE
ncbi:DUF748 domain-containing protein [Cerasicoccus arenae]|nr:DUF748 domain-containing protein [Cerasicoccus arenae]MBK1859043.1 DUF748 domain-containing protein [Cerasicoccus arenae]